jgi:hypothetical protein
MKKVTYVFVCKTYPEIIILTHIDGLPCVFILHVHMYPAAPKSSELSLQITETNVPYQLLGDLN